jgi:hypothetical protein
MNNFAKTVFWKIASFNPSIQKTTIIKLISAKIFQGKQISEKHSSSFSLQAELPAYIKQVNSLNSSKLLNENADIIIVGNNCETIQISKSVLNGNTLTDLQTKQKRQNVLFKSICIKDKSHSKNNKDNKKQNSTNKCQFKNKVNNKITKSKTSSLSNKDLNYSETNSKLFYNNTFKDTSKLNSQINNKKSDLVFFKFSDINNINNLISQNMSNMTAYQNIMNTNFNSNLSLFNDNKSTNLPKTTNNNQAISYDNLEAEINATLSANKNVNLMESSNKSSSNTDDIKIEDSKSVQNDVKAEEERLNHNSKEVVINNKFAGMNNYNDENYFNKNINNNNLINNNNTININNLYSSQPTENNNNNIYGNINPVNVNMKMNMSMNLNMNEELYKQIQNYNNTQHQLQVAVGTQLPQSQQKMFLENNNYNYITNKEIENNNSISSIHGYPHNPITLGGLPYPGYNLAAFSGYNHLNTNNYNMMNFNLGQLKSMNINHINNLPQMNNINNMNTINHLNTMNIPINGYPGTYNLVNPNLSFKNNYYEKEKLQEEISIPKKYLYRDNYLDLLLESYDLLKNKENLSKAIEEYEKEQQQEEEIKKQSQNDSYCNNALDTEYLKNGRFLRKCENKICTISERKKGSCKWHKVKIPNTKKSITICSLCYKAYRNKQYCYYCGQIYKETYCNQDTKMWIECSECKGWHHVSCEEQNGYYKDIASLAKDENFEYVCFTCRESKEFKDRKRKSLVNSNNTNSKPENKGSSALNFQEQKLLGRKIKNKGGFSTFPDATNNRMISRNTKKTNVESLPLSKFK